MNIDQLVGWRVRLQKELTVARSTIPWNRGRIDRLAGDLACAEGEIAALYAAPQEPDDVFKHAA
jgi:hypothetical protein